MIRRPRSTQSRGQDLFESRQFVAARHPVATRFPFHGRDRHTAHPAHPWSFCPSRHRAGDRPPRCGLPSTSVAGARVLASPPARAHLTVNRRKDQPTSGAAAVAALVGNLAIAGVTFGTALATGGSPVIAEGIHSPVDTGDGRPSGSVSAASRRGSDPRASRRFTARSCTSGRWSWPSWCSWGRHVGLAAPV
jgi:hypothetical protein